MIEIAMIYGLMVGSVQVGPYFIQQDYLYRGNIYTVIEDRE